MSIQTQGNILGENCVSAVHRCVFVRCAEYHIVCKSQECVV